MTVVPLPDTPCVRVRLSGNDDVPNEWGWRIFLKYSGSAPSGANCTTLAGDVASAWSSNLAQYMHTDNHLTEVDVIDIASYTGASGQWTGSDAGTMSGDVVPANAAVGVEFGIAFRYRGGKPRVYLPPMTFTALADQAHWNPTNVGDLQTSFAAFITAIEALSIGSMGTLTHTTLSYYQGFTNHTNTSGRAKAVPTYRATALHRDVTGYFAKTLVASQRRRRVATTQ